MGTWRRKRTWGESWRDPNSGCSYIVKRGHRDLAMARMTPLSSQGLSFSCVWMTQGELWAWPCGVSAAMLTGAPWGIEGLRDAHTTQKAMIPQRSRFPWAVQIHLGVWTCLLAGQPRPIVTPRVQSYLVLWWPRGKRAERCRVLPSGPRERNVPTNRAPCCPPRIHQPRRGLSPGGCLV